MLGQDPAKEGPSESSKKPHDPHWRKSFGFDVTKWAQTRLDAGLSARLGIMGGTFDPVHNGHLHCAERAREACGLDAVLFMPANVPHFKKGQVRARALDRLAMCRLAVAGNPSFHASDMELARGEVTYTVDTLRQLHDELPEGAQVVFILGADSLAGIMRWREAECLPRLAHYAAVTRPGFELDSELRSRLAEAGFEVTFVEVAGLDVSSTEVRERLARGDSARYLLPDSVLRYIEERSLYEASHLGSQDQGHALSAGEGACPEEGPEALSPSFFEERKAELEGRVSPKRFAHVMGVVDACERLARIYGVDVSTARLAGLLHDWDKGYDDEGIWERAASLGLDEELDPWVLANMPQVLHAHTAARALGRRFPQIPREVIQAIDRHTVGDENMTPLEMVLYCADCIEEGRTFGSIPELRGLAGQVSLEELFFRVYEFWTLNLLERRNQLHPATMNVWNALIARRQLRREEND